MSCSACASRVQKAAQAVSGVKAASVNLVVGELKVTSDNDLSEKIVKSVIKSGYEIEPLGSLEADSDPSADDSYKEFLSYRKELAVSLILTVAVMFLAMGHMFNLNVLIQVNLLLQAVLTLIVIFLSRKFFISAYRALTHLSSNMDTLVSLGALTAFVYSVYVLLTAHSNGSQNQGCEESFVFFESTCGILTFVGIGKYLEKRAMIKTSDVLNSLKKLCENETTLKDGERLYSVATKSVKAGAVAVYRQGQRISFDGVVVSGNSYLDESSITGESRLVSAHEGVAVKSGSVLTDGYLEVLVESDSENSLLGKIVQSVQNASMHKTPISRIADTLASYFVPMVVILSLFTFIYWYLIKDDPLALSIEFAVCVLVVSCPCALGLATPVAIVAGNGLAASFGIIFKSPQAIELLGKSKVFVFDKTGTLTYGSMKMGRVITANDNATEDEILTILCSLEKKSSHVIAQSVQKAYPDISCKDCDDYQYLYGMGVTGVIEGALCACGNSQLVKKLLGSADESFLGKAAGESMCIYVVKDKTLMGAVLFEDSIKEDSAYVIKELKKQGVQTVMLTGDTKTNAQKVADRIGIERLYCSFDPLMKSSYIDDLMQKGQKVTMIGDGINDAIALQKASVGIGLKGASDMAVKACDVILLSEKIKDVVTAFRISKKTINVIYQDLFFALVYNVIAIPLAVGMYYSSWNMKLTPVVCSVLMGLSSFCVVCNALRLSLDKSLKEKRQEAGSAKRTAVYFRLKIDGMHCKHCKATVEEALKEFLANGEVKVSLEDKSACFYGYKDSEKNIKKAVRIAGFELVEIKHDKP